MRIGRVITRCTVPDASKGPSGASVKEDPETSMAGQPGQVVRLMGRDGDMPIVSAHLSSSATLLYLETALRQAEVDYANGRFEEALDQLAWLGELLIDPTAHRSSRETVHDSGLVEDPPEPSMEFQAIRSKVFALMRRLSLGLDYWGKTRQFVPLLNRAFYTEEIDSLIEHARRIEHLYIMYRDAGDDWSAARSRIVDTLSSQQSFLTSMADRFAEINAIEASLVSDIEDLTNEYDACWRRVVEAGEEFKQAVRRETGGCEFKDVVVAVGAIATAVATMGTGAGVAIAALKTYSQFDARKHDPDDKLGDLAEPKYKIEKIAAVGKGVSEIAKGIEKISDVLDRPNAVVPELPSDAAKLMMSREDLEETIEPYRHLPEARAYLGRVDEFINLVTTRNNKIVEYNALTNARCQAEAEVDKAETEIARLRLSINRPNTRHLPEFSSFMGRATDLNKKMIFDLLHKQHRALEYWSGSRLPFTVTPESVDHLAIAHQSARARLIAAMENRSREPQNFKFEDKVGSFSILEDLGMEQLERFKRTGRLVFSLPYYPSFAQMALVRVARVRLKIPGLDVDRQVRDEDPVGIELEHLGNAMLRTLDDRLVEFTHEPRKTILFYHPGSESTRAFHLGGSSETYIKLTPEGPWRMGIFESDMGRARLSDVSDVVLEFEGEFFGQ